jgi:alkylation response protein AidB-like acyl-CoA dehydrogenase
MTIAGAAAYKGGYWLLAPTDPATVFTPARLSDEHRLIGRTAEEFAGNEVLPALDRLEQKDWGLARQLLRKAGDLGLLGTDVPEAYGGVELDKAASVVVAEGIARSASFGATMGAQANLTIMPLVCFGTEAQKRKYLPGLVSGELAGAYCLSESGSGSDALGAKARATAQPDGSFVLNGEKMWITNGGFADVFIVFAKIDGQHFTAFIVERAFGGVTSGKEEHKMGLHGSSTTPVILQEVRVPAANVLGEVGKGHKVAFNVLNYGRFKLAASTSGAARVAIAEAAKYAATRRQFGQPIAKFGAIRHKLAEMAIREYVVESLLYRTAGLIDGFLEAREKADGASVLAALEEFAVEASIAKVAGSEALDYILDENIQIHGGNGFVRDYPAERHYRDSRVNRIFEGTNEINRILIPTMLMRRAARGDLSLADAQAPAGTAEQPEEPLAVVNRCKRATVSVLVLAATKYGERISEEQEVLTSIADSVIDVFGAESATLRAMQSSVPALPADAARVAAHDAALRIQGFVRQALGAIFEGEELKTRVQSVDRLLAPPPLDTIALRRRIADAVVENQGYIFR